MRKLRRHDIELSDSTRALWHWCNAIKWNDRMGYWRNMPDTSNCNAGRQAARENFAESFQDFQKTFK